MEPIQSGDLIQNIHTGDIDKCIEIFEDGQMVVQMLGGARCVLYSDHYRKYIPNQHNQETANVQL
jgi:hypothetical protein